MTENGPILIVDDDPLVREVLAAAAEDAGFPVLLLAADDRQAVTAMETTPNLAGLITDIDLRSPRDGWAVADLARAARPDLSVIYVSGADTALWEDRGVAGSVMIQKPFAPLHVFAVLRNMLQRAAPRG